MQKSWGSIIAEARAELWTFPGEAKPLIASHTKYFHLAAMDLQHWIPELQVNNTSQHPFCSTYFDCGKTVVEAPIGVVKRVYTVVGEEWCDRVYYDANDYCEVECWARNLLTFTTPDNDGMAKLPMGFRFAEASSDSTCGRARIGIWGLHRGRLHVAPWLQSNETLVVEWDGIKKEWSAEDQLETDLWDDRVINAIKMFVKWYHEKFHGCDPQKKLDAERDYNNERADLIHYFAEIARARGDVACCDGRLATSAEIEDDDAELDQTVIIANIADFGDGGTNMQSVATLVNSWEPDWVTTNGDNWYGSLVSPADFEAKSSKWYRDFIYPYLSFEDPKLTSEAVINRFFPAFGDHDYDPSGRLAIELALLHVPKVTRGGLLVPSTGYYSVRPLNGFVEHFMFDQGYNQADVLIQADGNDVGSIQAVWLELALKRSTARWKVVHIGACGYTSKLSAGTAPTYVGDGTQSYAAIRRIINKLKLWGADIVFCGDVHNYERLNVMGLPVINNGSGGSALLGLGTAVPFSVFRNNSVYGAVKCTATCDSFTSEFYSSAGVLIDSLELTKT